MDGADEDIKTGGIKMNSNYRMETDFVKGLRDVTRFQFETHNINPSCLDLYRRKH